MDLFLPAKLHSLRSNDLGGPQNNQCISRGDSPTWNFTNAKSSTEIYQIDSIVQDHSISSALALALNQLDYKATHE